MGSKDAIRRISRAACHNCKLLRYFRNPTSAIYISKLLPVSSPVPCILLILTQPRIGQCLFFLFIQSGKGQAFVFHIIKQIHMKEDLRISVIQSSLFWERRQDNLCHFEGLVAKAAGKSDLVVLPEMFTTGFSMNPGRLAEPMDGATMQAVKEWARKFGLAVAGSFIAEEGNHYYNRAFFAEPGGQLACYDKRHLFSMAGEDKHYTAGKQPLVVSYKGWNIALFICYDLRFPVWSRNTGNRYDMAVYMANWPEARASVWKPLLLARALENQAYVCGVNRTGVDGKGFAYRGGSVVYSPKGETILDAADREEAVETAALSYAGLDTFRTKFPVSNDADTFHIG